MWFYRQFLWSGEWHLLSLASEAFTFVMKIISTAVIMMHLFHQRNSEHTCASVRVCWLTFSKSCDFDACLIFECHSYLRHFFKRPWWIMNLKESWLSYCGLLVYSVVRWVGADILPLKFWYLSTRRHVVITQKSTIWISISMKISDLWNSDVLFFNRDTICQFTWILYIFKKLNLEYYSVSACYDTYLFFNYTQYNAWESKCYVLKEIKFSYRFPNKTGSLQSASTVSTPKIPLQIICILCLR